MTQNKSINELAMDQTRIPSSAGAVTATLSKSLKDGEVLADDGQSYSSVQTAENNASSWIKLSPSTFTESVTVNTVGITIEGSGRNSEIDGGTTGDAIDLDGANDAAIRNLSAKTTAGSGNNFDAISSQSASDNCVFNNIFVAESDRGGIRDNTFASVRWTIVNCRIENADNRATNIQPQSIDKGNIYSANGDQAGIRSDSVAVNNIIINQQNGGSRGYSVGGDDGIASGIRIINSAGDGLALFSGDTDNIVSDCRISGSGGTDFVDNGTSTLVAEDDSANSTIITDDMSGQQSS